MTWRFLDTGKRNAAFNMAVDEALLRGVIEGSSPPTLRTYGWNPPAYSIGCNQDMDDQVDTAACETHGIGRVRRFTGGRTVLHGWDLTYAVTASIDHLVPGGAVSDAYRLIGVGLVEALGLLGASAEFARPDFRDPAGRTAKPCFVSISRYEVSCGGKKIIGSAQRVIGKALLQHGSLPLARPPVDIADLIPNVTDRDRRRIGKELALHSTDLSAEIGRASSYEEVRDALVRGFESVLGKRLQRGVLTPGELGILQELESEKYGNPLWNDHRKREREKK